MQKALVKRESPEEKKLALALAAGKKGNYSRAVIILRELISSPLAPPHAWLLLGRAHHALKDYSRALAAFNDYIRLKPRSGEGYLFAGRAYLALGMPYRAVPFLRKSLENSPGNSAAIALLGIAYLKSKHSQAAVDLLEEAVKAAPEDRRIYRAYLNSLLVRGIRLSRGLDLEDYELGFQMLRFVLDNGSDAGLADNPFLRLHLGRAARETGRLEEALEHTTAALKLAGDDRRIRWSRASLLMALGKSTEARKEIEKIRSRDADVPELPWNSELVDLFMIRSFLTDGEWRAAAAACRDVLKRREAGPRDEGREWRPMIHALCAEALRNLRNFQAAHNHLRRALEEDPQNMEFWYADILVSWEGKDYGSLKKALKAVKSLKGEPDIINRFSVLYQARTADDPRKNITLLQDAVRTLGPEPELMAALGEAYLKVGLLEESRNWFQKTAGLKPGHESARLGEIAALEALLAQGLPQAKAKDASIRELGSLYRNYLEKWPDNSSIRREWALFLVKTCEYADATAELEKLLAWEPSNPSLRRVLAYAYRKTGRYQEAAVFLKSLLREKPRDLALLIEYSGCLERAGAGHYAIAVLEKARELFHSVGQRRRSGPGQGRKPGYSPEAGLSDLSLALGILYFRQKNTEKAFDHLREAAALDGADSRPYEWMAIVARENGETGEADRCEKQAEKRKKYRKSRN